MVAYLHPIVNCIMDDQYQAAYTNHVIDPGESEQSYRGYMVDYHLIEILRKKQRKILLMQSFRKSSIYRVHC
jgi:hypothetical protein